MCAAYQITEIRDFPGLSVTGSSLVDVDCRMPLHCPTFSVRILKWIRGQGADTTDSISFMMELT